MATEEDSKNALTKTEGDELMYGYTLLLIVYIIIVVIIGRHIMRKTWKEMDND